MAAGTAGECGRVGPPGRQPIGVVAVLHPPQDAIEGVEARVVDAGPGRVTNCRRSQQPNVGQGEEQADDQQAAARMVSLGERQRQRQGVSGCGGDEAHSLAKETAAQEAGVALQAEGGEPGRSEGYRRESRRRSVTRGHVGCCIATYQLHPYAGGRQSRHHVARNRNGFPVCQRLGSLRSAQRDATKETKRIGPSRTTLQHYLVQARCRAAHRLAGCPAWVLPPLGVVAPDDEALARGYAHALGPGV